LCTSFPYFYVLLVALGWCNDLTLFGFRGQNFYFIYKSFSVVNAFWSNMLINYIYFG
jgi:hypothetical protein